jgi:hypothetical protein
MVTAITRIASSDMLASTSLGRMTTKTLRTWFCFSLRGMFIVITLFGVWLGRQVQWMRERHEARAWIVAHETGTHVARDGIDDDYWSTELVNGVAVTTRKKVRNAPWSIRILGEERLPFITLEKSKLSESDIPRIDSLHALFPEANGVQVHQPGLSTRWPPENRTTFKRYPSQWIDGK